MSCEGHTSRRPRPAGCSDGWRVPQSARGQGEPQPFTHLSVPNADLYRSLLRTFAQAKERFIVHLRPEDRLAGALWYLNVVSAPRVPYPGTEAERSSGRRWNDFPFSKRRSS
ncbi:MAG: DUF2397 family protein [Streptosporangiaceae bacterium]